MEPRRDNIQIIDDSLVSDPPTQFIDTGFNDIPKEGEFQESKIGHSRDESRVSEIQPPALLLNDNQCEWDSMLELDITRDGIDPNDLEIIQK